MTIKKRIVLKEERISNDHHRRCHETDFNGLPNQNSGRFVSEGVLQDTTGITLKPADPLHGKAGGLSEIVIPNPQKQIKLQNVQGINPEF
jgi:hypothetical protein